MGSESEKSEKNRKMLILRQSGLARRLVSTQGPNVFTASATERLSPFSGAIWDETVKHFGYDIETRQSPDEYELTRKPRRYEMRGGNHLVRTHWWLAQGDFFIKQIAAVNIEYITPSYDQYGASSGLQGFVTNIVPQLRFKNQHVVITTNRNEAATPYIQFFFKDGRGAMVNCYKTSMEDIVAHLRTTFYAKPGTSPYDENDEYDADGRLTNPFSHVPPRCAIANAGSASVNSRVSWVVASICRTSSSRTTASTTCVTWAATFQWATRMQWSGGSINRFSIVEGTRTTKSERQICRGRHRVPMRSESTWTCKLTRKIARPRTWVIR